MNIVMPMAGRGSRFVKAGYDLPKPLIDVFGSPMYSWAMRSLPLEMADTLIFVCQAEQLDHQGLREDIQQRYGDTHHIEIIALNHVTRGQAETVLLAREFIDNDQPLLIYNADTFCADDISSNLANLPPSVDGLLTVFSAEGDHWSFARTDSEGKVVETAEKRRISEWATTGLYYFRRGSEFVRYTDAMIAANERENNEFYVAPLYNRLIAEGADVRIENTPGVWGLGTPEELERFLLEYPR